MSGHLVPQHDTGTLYRHFPEAGAQRHAKMFQINKTNMQQLQHVFKLMCLIMKWSIFVRRDFFFSLFNNIFDFTLQKMLKYLNDDL